MLEKMQSENINELACALSKAQGELSPAIKDSKNPFFKSNYADLSSVWNACQEPLSKNGLAIIQTMDMKDGQSVLITTLAHSSGQWVRSCLPLLNEKANAQGLGASITYMRRYGLSAIIGITCDEDDDANAACLPRITSDQVKYLESLLRSCPENFVKAVKDQCAATGIREWKNLNAETYEKIIESINIKFKKAA
jgi:hypothetical protein